ARGGLAASALAHQTQRFPSADGEGHAVYGLHRADLLGENNPLRHGVMLNEAFHFQEDIVFGPSRGGVRRSRLPLTRHVLYHLPRCARPNGRLGMTVVEMANAGSVMAGRQLLQCRLRLFAGGLSVLAPRMEAA